MTKNARSLFLEILKASSAVGAATAVLALCVTFAGAAERIVPPEKMRRTQLENFQLLSEFEISKDDLLQMRRHLTNVRRVVGQDFAFFPKQRIDVYLSDKDTFSAYTSMPQHVTGMFNGSIHLPLPSVSKNEEVLQSVLWHEYTHAMIFALTGGRCPAWLNEGLATYEENRVLVQDMTPLRVAVAEAGGSLPVPLNEMNAAVSGAKGDAAGAVRAMVAYQQAMVFADYLFSRYSRATIRDFLIALGKGASPAKAFKEVFHMEPDDMQKRWAENLGKFI